MLKDDIEFLWIGDEIRGRYAGLIPFYATIVENDGVDAVAPIRARIESIEDPERWDDLIKEQDLVWLTAEEIDEVFYT